MAFTTLLTLKDYLGIDRSDTVNDTQLQLLIDSVSLMIPKYCRREFESKERTETYSGTGKQYLLLKVLPITSIKSIIIDTDTLTTSDYTVLSEEGTLYRESGWGSQALGGLLLRDLPSMYQARNISVTYTGGFIMPGGTGTRNLPSDLELACLSWCENLWNHTPQNQRMTSENMGGVSLAYSHSAMPPPIAEQILDSYKEYMI